MMTGTMPDNDAVIHTPSTVTNKKDDRKHQQKMY